MRLTILLRLSFAIRFYILFAFTISFCFNSYAQATPKRNNEIDLLQTDKDVMKFLKQHFPSFDNHISYRRYYDSVEQLTADSLHVKNWVKADLDNNGQTDLFIFGSTSAASLYVILSLDNHYKIISPGLDCKFSDIFPVIKRIDNLNSIFLYNYFRGFNDSLRQFIYPKLDCDTIIIKDSFL